MIVKFSSHEESIELVDLVTPFTYCITKIGFDTAERGLATISGYSPKR